ncbi:MAG: 50S ribosomal protein L11 methyltransferase [Steroidobacterales bacterium]
MHFYEIEFPLAGLGPDAVEAALLQSGAQSITFLDCGDEPVLEPRVGEMRLWHDTLVRALFDSSSDAAGNLGRLAATLGPQITRDARVRGVEDRVWERVWLADWKSMRFGARLWVCPVDAPAPADPGAVIVRMDPGLAFGTGTHPTTALCLEALSALDLSGKSVIDYGCGSGLLSVAAIKLGAARAIAVDLDPQALTAARENALRNGVAGQLTAVDTAAALPPSDCVVANILASTLLDLLPALAGACRSGGDLLLSGVLSGQADAVAAAYAPYFSQVSTMIRDDWCCLHARRRDVPGAGRP